MENTTEKFYMACESPQEGLRAEYGPFRTSGEAEREARKLGWNWVLVYTHIVKGDVIVDVKTRFYVLESLRDQLRSAGVTPMRLDEKVFFARYEKQMERKDADLDTTTA